jgi:hypothetical protein
VAASCAGIPFIALIAITSSCAVYFIAGLSLSPFSRFVYFVIDLFMALLTVRSDAVCGCPAAMLRRVRR